MPEASALERGVKGVAGERPERQLNDVMIEFHRRVLEIMQAVDDQHGDECAGRANKRPRGSKDQAKATTWRPAPARNRRRLAPNSRCDDLDQPPRQRRQLVVAELPFSAVGQRLDEIERQVGVEQCRQRGPDREMQGQEAAEAARGRRLDPADKPGERSLFRRLRRGPQWLPMSASTFRSGLSRTSKAALSGGGDNRRRRPALKFKPQSRTSQS